MKHPRVFPLCLVFLSFIVFAGIASAQPAETNALEWRQIPIKNIRPSMLVYWIDPAHLKMPVEYQRASDYLNQVMRPKQAMKAPFSEPASSSVLKMPNGVTRIFADDANNVIWARSTPDGFAQLKPIVEFLDRPIRKIAFNIKMIEVNSVDASTVQTDPMLKVLFGPADPRGYHYFVDETKGKSLLFDLIKNEKATIIKTSQFVIRNNLTDRFTTTTSSPVTINIKQAEDGSQILSTQNDIANPLLMKRRLSLVLTPTINNDDTITLFFTEGVNAELTHQKPAAKNDLLQIKNLENQQRMTSVCTLQSGNSLLFTGYNSTMLGLNNNNHPIVLLVTAEIEK